MKNSRLFSRSRIAVLAAFFINGALFATWASRIPAVQAKLGLSEGALGFVLAGTPIGLLSALVLVSYLITKWGSKKVVLAMAMTSSAALVLLALAPNAIVLFLALVVFGGGISAMDVAMNEQAVFVEREVGKPIMSSFHAGYSIGGFAGALLGALAASIPFFDVFNYFLFSAILFSLMILIVYPHMLSMKPRQDPDAPIFQLPARPLWILGFVGLASALGEGVSADWSAVFLTRSLNSDASIAALGFAAFSLAMTTGRIFGDWLTEKLRPSGIVRWGGLLSGAGFILVVTSASPAIAIVGFALVGIGLANTIPVLFSVAGNLPGISPGAAIAGVATISYIGFLAGPPLIGSLAEMVSFRLAFLVVAIITATMAISSSALKRKEDHHDSGSI